jgi:transcriptional regulator with XRE-family HTH domain
MAQKMSPNRSSIAKFIKEKRESLGWSQRELARRLGCPHATVQQWESEKTTPDTEKLSKLASLFGLHLSEFFAAVEGDTNFIDREGWNLAKMLNGLDQLPRKDMLSLGNAVMEKLAQAS